MVNTTPAHRRDRRGRGPVREPLRDELALRPEPRVPADRHLQPRQRREHPRHVHRRHASRPSSRRCGTPATAPASSASGTWATARPTGSATTRTGFDYWDALIDQGEYHDPRFLSADGLRVEPGYATDLITDLAIRWLGSLDGGRAVVPPGLAQGPAPALGTGRRAYRPVCGPRDPGARHLHRRLRHPLRHRPSGGHERRRRPHRGGPETACPARAFARGRGAVEVPALHGGLPRLRGLGRRQRRPARRVAARPRRPRRHRAPLRLGPGLLPRRPRLVRQAVHVRGVDPDAVPRVVPARGRRRARRIPASSATSTSPRPCSRRRASPPTRGCRAARSGPTSPEPATPTRRTTGCTTATGCTTTAATTSARTTGSAPTGTASSTSTTTASACPAAPTSATRPSGSSTTCSTDPAELHNVADDPAYASVRADLERRLWRAQASVGDDPHPEQPRPADV